jgi:hypothetical protein
MLRQALGAGGLGNLKVTDETLAGCGAGSIEAFLEQALAASDRWDRDVILVEPFLDIVATPVALVRIVDGVPRLVADVLSVKRDEVFIGGIIPSGLPRELLDRTVAMTMRYARRIAERYGIRNGYLDVDWGVTRDRSLVAFESNFRWTGNNHPVAIRSRLRSDNASGLVSWSHDALKVSEATTLSDALRFLGRAGIGWDTERGEGVVVTIPPASGSMGYVALAETFRRAEEMHAAMEDFSQATKASTADAPCTAAE